MFIKWAKKYQDINVVATELTADIAKVLPFKLPSNNIVAINMKISVAIIKPNFSSKST